MRPPSGYANAAGGAANDNSWTFNPGATEFVPGGVMPGGGGGRGSPASPPGQVGPMHPPMNPPMPPGPMPPMGAGPRGAPMHPMAQMAGVFPPMAGQFPGNPWGPQPPMPGMPPWPPVGPGMPMGPQDWNTGQPPRGPMPSYAGGHHAAGSAPGIGNQMSANGANLGSASHSAPAAIEPPSVFVAIWNLHPDVSEKELKEELSEVDFLPEEDSVGKFKEVTGAYLCGFHEEYFANAFVISFDDTSGLLRSAVGENIRAAKWTQDSEWGEENSVPSAIQSEFPGLRDELLNSKA